MTVTKFLQNESNKPSEEFVGHNDLNSIYHSYLKRKVYLEKDLNALKFPSKFLTITWEDTMQISRGSLEHP